MIRVVIFDMDGVIIDSEPIHFNIERQMFEESNIPVSHEEHCRYVGTSSQNMWQIILSRYNLSYDAEELARKQHGLYMKSLLHGAGLQPVPGVVELIQALYKNKFKLVLASSSYMEVIDVVLERLNLSGYFAAKFSGAEMTFSKPHPEIFLRSAQHANCEPGECLVIEDSENGVRSAKDAGMKCIGFLNPNSGTQNLSKADLIIHGFQQISLDLIKSLT